MLRQYISLPFCILQMEKGDPLWEESSLIAGYRESPSPGPAGTNVHGPDHVEILQEEFVRKVCARKCNLQIDDYSQRA